MVTSVHINYLQNYRNTINKWIENTRECRIYKHKNGRLNAAQLLDMENTLKDRNKVISELCRLEREIESRKISTQNLFKTN